MEAFAQFIPLILIFAIMYFLLIRPQQRKLKDHKKMVESLRRGDMIVTQGGLIGKVTKVKEDNELEVELLKIRQRASAELVNEQLAANESYIIYQNMLNGCQAMLVRMREKIQVSSKENT